MSEHRSDPTRAPDCPAQGLGIDALHQQDPGDTGRLDGERKQPQYDPDIVPKFGALGRRALLFTPSWFSINMGTGITSILLHNLPYQFRGLQQISVAICILNILLFCVFLALSLARYSIWPKVFPLMLKHSSQAFFLGTFSMGFATIVNMTAFVGIPAFGQGFVVFAWTLWWIDAFISLLVGIGVPFAMFNYHNQSLETVTGAWLLPVVSPIVSAATGGIVAEYLPPAHARLTLVCSYIIWGCGFPIAVLVMAIYFQRLAVHHLPPRATIVSVFLPLGPCGQGSFALLQFAKVVRKLADDTGVGLGNGSSFDRQSQQVMALAIYAVSLPVALVIWGMGLFWLVIAVGSIIKVGLEEDRFPFNMGWWGFTFPLGVFTVSTVNLADFLDSTAFKILGTILSLIETLLWVILIIRTAVQAFQGRLFISPCLGDTGKSLASAEEVERCACQAKKTKDEANSCV